MMRTLLFLEPIVSFERFSQVRDARAAMLELIAMLFQDDTHQVQQGV
jgi:hypothetical protein